MCAVVMTCLAHKQSTRWVGQVSRHLNEENVKLEDDQSLFMRRTGLLCL